ncbi:hypothetical protein JOM56_004617 [Amanita muscaria]
MGNLCYIIQLPILAILQRELDEKYCWYWMIEPEVHLHCNINFNPLFFMEDKNLQGEIPLGVTRPSSTGCLLLTLWRHVRCSPPVPPY